MYHIIGSDGKEYGPVSQEELQNWIARGLANAQTQARLEGTTNWKPLGEFPEFGLAAPPPASAGGIQAPPGTTSGYASPAPANAQQMVHSPAIGLIVTAILGCIANATGIIINLLGGGLQHQQVGQMPEIWAKMFTGTMAIVSGALGILFGIVVLVGALQMMKLKSHAFALAASIIAAVPCVSPCCFIGLPIGIWAIVILLKPEVKSAFH